MKSEDVDDFGERGFCPTRCFFFVDVSGFFLTAEVFLPGAGAVFFLAADFFNFDAAGRGFRATGFFTFLPTAFLEGFAPDLADGFVASARFAVREAALFFAGVFFADRFAETRFFAGFEGEAFFAAGFFAAGFDFDFAAAALLADAFLRADFTAGLARRGGAALPLFGLAFFRLRSAVLVAIAISLRQRCCVARGPTLCAKTRVANFTIPALGE